LALQYSLDEKPPLLPWLLFGLQWLAIALPSLVIIGQVVATLHFDTLAGQVLYLQKLAFVVGLAMFAQILWGHRLPLVMGPAAVLLVGVLASQGFSLATVYTAVMVGGAVMALVSALGIFRMLQRLSTVRVVAVVLLLIAFTLTPAIRDLMLHRAGAGAPFAHLGFAMTLALAMFLVQRRLTPLWRSTLIVWALLFGALIYGLIFAQTSALATGDLPMFAGFWRETSWPFSFDIGVILAFLVCFVALAINDLGSIQALEGILQPGDMGGRLSRGMTLTGLAGLLAGGLGVLGPVNFSLSPGVVAATGCASRYTLLPAAGILLLLAFMPAALALAGSVPPPVVGAVLLFILSAQVSAGIQALCATAGGFRFEHGLVVGLPVLAGTILAFVPAEIAATLPALLQPVFGNGFVVGVLLALVLEHGIFRFGSES